VENVERVTRRVEVFDGACRVRCVLALMAALTAPPLPRPAVVSRPLEWLQQPNVTLLKAVVTSVDTERQARACAPCVSSLLVRLWLMHPRAAGPARLHRRRAS
jgi:hypothetical protein